MSGSHRIGPSGNASGGSGLFNPTMQRFTYYYVVGNTLTAFADTGISSFGTTGGGGSTLWGVTPASAGTASGINSNNSWYSTEQNLNAFFNYGINRSTNVRGWACVTDQSGATMLNSDTPTGSYLGFRYSTTASDAHWQAVASSAGTMTIVDTGVAVNTGVTQQFFIAATTTSVKFYISNVLVATITTNIPLSGVLMGMVAGITAISTTGAKMRFGHAFIGIDNVES